VLAYAVSKHTFNTYIDDIGRCGGRCRRRALMTVLMLTLHSKQRATGIRGTTCPYRYSNYQLKTNTKIQIVSLLRAHNTQGLERGRVMAGNVAAWGKPNDQIVPILFILVCEISDPWFLACSCLNSVSYMLGVLDPH
jgi:hypothetical protein